MSTIFCLRCKRQQEINNAKIVKTNNGRFRLSAQCRVCETQTSKFISTKSGSGLREIANQFNLKLPFELHMILQNDEGNIKRASFCGPGTKLDRRLRGLNRETATFESVITPPVNDLDRACLRHDVFYSANKDVPTRNKADAVLARDAQEVQNNAKRRLQRFNAGLVKNVMLFKVKHRI